MERIGGDDLLIWGGVGGTHAGARTTMMGFRIAAFYVGVNTSNARLFWGNGHYYAFTQENATWHDAFSRSNVNLGQLGTNGYLATVTSADEQNFIFNYSFNGGKIPNPGFLGATDSEKEGTWTWRAGPETGQVFRTSNTNQMYTNWDKGEPNNSSNQDYLQIKTSGYWDDRDPASINGYVTEWGSPGAEFTARFVDLNSDDTANGYENGMAAPKMTIRFNRKVPDDYVDIRNDTPLIDIPITFGGTAKLGTDYNVSVSDDGGKSGKSYLSGGRLYVRNTLNVVLTFNPINNNSWQAPRTITASLGGDGSENIYAISGNSNSQVWLFDDEPQLSLGQGAYKFIRTPLTSTNSNLPEKNSDFSTNSDALLFDNDGINESRADFNSIGLNEKFAIRWETYLRIPETGSYTFKATGNGSVLTKHNNATGEEFKGPTILNNGAVVWLRFDYKDQGGASAKLTWDRPNGSGGMVSNEVVPAKAMFLSESLARGVNRTESDSDNTSLGFQLFANKSTISPINIQLTSSSETANSTSNTTLAQRQTGSTRVGDDYAILDGGALLNTGSIGLNGVVKGSMISPFGTVATRATTSRDTSTGLSPVRGVPLRMNVTGNDPYIETYNSSQWNVADARQGDTWTVSVYAKADRSTSGQLFIFEANDKGEYTKGGATTIQLGTEWQRYSYTYTFTDSSTRSIQVRLDGPDSGGTGASIWWDGLQVERASQASPFSASSEINRFAAKFNPLDLHSGGFGTLSWQPDRAFGTLQNVRSFDVKVLSDSYAEDTESITLTLANGTGYGVSNNSQTITIADNPFVLSLKAGQNPTEASANETDLGWFAITANKPAPDGGLRVRYSITGGSAKRDVDYYAPKSTLVTGDGFKPEDLVVLPKGATEARIYISAIADAIREGNETVTLKLIPNVETDDKGFTFQRYNIDSSKSEDTLTITDSTAFAPAVVVTPADRTGLATVRAQLVNGKQQASFDVRLTSQPRDTVTVILKTSSGTLSTTQLKFSSSNWTQAQRVNLSGLRTDQASSVSLSTSSNDTYYANLNTSQRVIPSNWPSELGLSLWEGGSPVPMQPAASVQAIDGTEGSNSRLGFELNLASPVTGSPVELLYQLNGANGFNLDGSHADAIHKPQASYRPLVLNNGNSSGGPAYANFAGLTTVSSSGEISAEAWVRRDAGTKAAGVLEFTDNNGHNQITLGFHDTTGKPKLEIRDPGGALLLSLIADNEVGLGEWNHLAYSVNARGVASLYLNGDLAKQGQLSHASGLKVSLYEGKNFETLRSNSGESKIDFDDSYDTAKGGDGNTFSIRATGQIQARTNGDNSFAVLSDNGVRVWINGQQVVNNWTDHGATWNSFIISNLVAGEWYDIQIDYYENGGSARLQLADRAGGTPITALRYVPLFDTARSLNYIGRSALVSSGSGYLRGSVRDVGIWNAARSQEQVQASMHAAQASGTGLISALALNNSTANRVAGAPAAVLHSGSSNSASFATTPIYGIKMPVGASSVSLPTPAVDDLTAEGTESLTLTLINSGLYSIGGSTGTATAYLQDNDIANVLFLSANQTGSTDGATIWTPTSQFRVRESDASNETITPLGIRLNSRPTAAVTLTLDPLSYDSGEIQVTNPANPAATAVQLVFTPDNWNQIQPLHLQGIDDDEDDDDTTQQLSFTLTSSDPIYAAIRPSVSMLVIDNDATTASELLATVQSATAPLATITGPSQSTIHEAGNDSATFTIRLPGASSEDTLVFLEVDRRLSQVSASDISVSAGSGNQSMGGLTRFDSASGAGETAKLDNDGINESSTSFKNNNLTGNFTNTWSGYVYIPETGSYNFSIPVQGGTRLSLDGQIVIDKLNTNAQATWSTGTIQANRGDFLAIKLDYKSFNTSLPSVALKWKRPTDGGTKYLEEVVPSAFLSRTNGFSVLIPKGSTSGTYTIKGVQDQVAEGVESLATSLLTAHGVGLIVQEQSGTAKLLVTLATTDRESITLAKGSVLALGEDLANKSETIATFTLSAAATIHRDRTTGLAGTLAWTEKGKTSAFSSSVVGLVAGHGSDLYQIADPSVLLTLTAPLTANGSKSYLANLRLEATNRSTVTIPSGTMLSYRVDSTGEFISLVLSNSLTLRSGETATNVVMNESAKSTSLVPTAATTPLVGLSSSYVLPNTNVVQLIDDDHAGLFFSLDAAGTNPIDSTPINLSEGGSSTNRYVRLISQPTASVTVYVETDDASEVLLQVPSSNPAPAGSRIALTFKPSNWQTAQAFTVVPADDKLVDGTQNVDLHVRTTSSDSFYNINEANLPKLPFRVNDNDTATLLVELQQSTISKAGNGFLNLSLTAQPTADVTVSLVPSDSQFTINNRSIGRGETLIFTPANWSTIQTISLWAVDDSTVEDITRSQLQIITTSSDASFNGLSINPVQIDIVDNDLPQALITLISDSSEDAKPGRFRIELTNPAPNSAGSNGIQVNYQISALSLDPGLGYPATPSSINKITQSPGRTSGQVRIAPGRTSSDVIVVPIDDFIQDKDNKTFTVQLTAGEGYSLSNDAVSNSATVQIINNDVAGVVLFTSGERVLVKETGEIATYQLALLSQPSHNVTVKLSERIPSGASRQLGTSSAAYEKTLTFTPSNWYTAQQVSVWAYDDAKIEDGTGDNQFTGIHAAQLSYNFSSVDDNYNSAKNNDSHFTNMVQAVDVLDFELPSQTAEALHSSLTSLQEGIDSLSLPIVGSLDGKAGDGLRKFITNLVNSVRQISTPTPKKLSKLLSEQIADALGIPETAVTVSLAMQGTSAVVVSFQFADSYDIFSVPLAADFGLPGLGFQSEGTLDAYFSYDAGLELVFPRSGEIYLNTNNDKTFLSAEFNTSLSPDFKLTGGLGFLQLDAVNQASVNDNVKIKSQPASTALDVAFSLDLSGDAGSDGKLTLREFSSLDLGKVFQYEIAGDAAMSFGVTTSVNGSAAIPSLSFDLASLLPLFNYSNKDQAGAADNKTSFYFDNIKLDLGSYITQMLAPIVDGLDSILNPLYPIVDALYSDTHIFSAIGIEKTFDVNGNGQVSPLDLASWFADFYATFDPARGKVLKTSIDATIEFLDVIKGVMDLIRDLEQMKEEGSFYVDYGSYVLPAFSAGDQSASTESVVIDKDSTPALSSNTGDQAKAGGNNSSGKSSKSFGDIMKRLNDLGFEIPLIDDPKNAIKLLLGQDVSLFEWRMPGMGMTSEIEQSFPIYPGIEGIIEGGFGVGANIGFGFDTHGLNEWKQSGFKAGDAWKVFNGFYVADWDTNGVDVPEFTMDATMGAGLGLSALVVRSDITGGLEAAVSFDLLDEGEIAGTSDGKIRGSEISNRISKPLDLFEMVGSLSAYLKATVEVGIDMGFYSIWDTVWQENLAEIPLFEFGVGGSYGSGSVSNGYLQGTTVFFDGNGNLTIDPYEPSTTSGDDAHYNLRIDHRTFDTNRNGTIDLSEGRLVAFGGIDSTTGLPLEVPFLAALGQMLTPLTTLHTLAIDSGLNDEDASKWIDQAFALGGFDYLREDPVLRLNQAAGATATASEWDAMAAYIGHIKLHFGWDMLAYSLQKLLSEQYPEDIHTELGLITAFTQELLELSADTPINNRLATAALRTITRHQPDLPSAIAALAPLAGKKAANANWELSQQIDAILASAKASEISLPEAQTAINGLKQAAFAHYRAEMDNVSHELYLINDASQLRRAVHERLQRVHHGFVAEQFSSEAGQLIDGLDFGWILEEGSALVSPTTFSARNALQALGVNLGAQQLAFTLNANPNQSDPSPQVRLLANLEGLGLDQRMAGHAFTYFVDTDLTPSSFLYDGNSRTGARLFNLGAGLPLVAELNYIDNERGDRDLREGVIQDPGTFGELIQDHHFMASTESPILTVASNTTNPLPAAVFATSKMVRSGATSNQVGYIVIASGEDWDPGRITVESLRERLQILGGTLESSNTPNLGSNTSLSRELQFTTGDQLVFLELSDLTIWDLDDRSTTLDQLSNRIGTMQLSISSAGGIATLNSQRSGLSIQLALQEEEATLAGFVARQQHQAAVLDFTGLGEARVEGVLELAREASHNTRLSFYRVLDANGAVANPDDPITGKPILPGHEGYTQAAMANRVDALTGLSTNNTQTTSREITLAETFMLAPYAEVDTGKTQHTFFAFSEANADGVQHFQVLGDNVFGFEDLYGGGDRDFDDLIFSFKPAALIDSPPLA